MSDDNNSLACAAICRLLISGEFAKADQMLAETDVSNMSTFELRAMLVFTLSSSSELPSRRDFYRRAFERVAELRGVKMAKRLLRIMR